MPCGPILSLADLVQHPQVAAAQTDPGTGAPASGRYHAIAPPFRLTGSPSRPSGPAPGLGAHTEEVLREFGLSAEEITRLI